MVLLLSCIAITLVRSDGPFTNIPLINHARFVGDHIFVIPSGTPSFQSGPAIRFVPPLDPVARVPRKAKSFVYASRNSNE